LSVNGCGFGVVELSHRSKEYMDIHNRAESSLRKLLEIPSNYKILFLQGGATTQFASICLNLMKENKTANYLVTAHWGEKAIEECKKYGNPVEVVPMK
jgi:phosphoserine aminotransferase